MANAPTTTGRGRNIARDDDAPVETRQSRDQESRALDDAHAEWEGDWNPSAGMLDTARFPAREGFAQRWVRTKINGVDDPKNIVKRYNEGYRPRNASTVPAGTFAPTVQHEGNSVIGIDGLVLMERPLRIHNKHAAYNRENARRQMEAVESQLQSSHETGNGGFGAPRISSVSDVSQGSRPAPVADD